MMLDNFNTIYKEKSLIVSFGLVNEPGDTPLVDFVQSHGQVIDFFAANEHITKKHVLVVGGGMSAEREVSYMSANGIVRAVLELGHHVSFVDMGADFAQVVSKLKPDVVYNALHGTYGEDGCLPALLNIMRVPYTGSGVLASSISFNKKKSYEIFRANNILVPESKIIRKSDGYKSDPIPRPYVIKPLSQGSSIGVQIVFQEDGFSFENYDFPYGNEVIIEQYIKGREMQIAVLNGRAIGVLEVKFLKGKRFYDYETKYMEGFAEHICPAQVTETVYTEIKELSEKACHILGCSGMVRAEIIYCEDSGKIYMLEVNTHPGMTPLSICPEIAELENMSYKDIVREMLEAAKFE